MAKDKNLPPDISGINKKLYPRQYIASTSFGSGRSSLHLNANPDPSGYRQTTFLESSLKSASLDGLIQELQKLKTKYDKRNETAYLFRGRTYYEGDEPDLFFAPACPETDEEYLARVEGLKSEEVSREESLRRQYEELKKRFG